MMPVLRYCVGSWFSKAKIIFYGRNKKKKKKEMFSVNSHLNSTYIHMSYLCPLVEAALSIDEVYSLSYPCENV